MDHFATALEPLLEPGVWLSPVNSNGKVKGQRKQASLQLVMNNTFKEATQEAYNCRQGGGSMAEQREAFRGSITGAKGYQPEKYPQVFWDCIDKALDGEGMIYTPSIMSQEQERLGGWGILFYFVCFLISQTPLLWLIISCQFFCRLGGCMNRYMEPRALGGVCPKRRKSRMSCGV